MVGGTLIRLRPNAAILLDRLDKIEVVMPRPRCSAGKGGRVDEEIGSEQAVELELPPANSWVLSEAQATQLAADRGARLVEVWTHNETTGCARDQKGNPARTRTWSHDWNNERVKDLYFGFVQWCDREKIPTLSFWQWSQHWAAQAKYQPVSNMRSGKRYWCLLRVPLEPSVADYQDGGEHWAAAKGIPVVDKLPDWARLGEQGRLLALHDAQLVDTAALEVLVRDKVVATMPRAAHMLDYTQRLLKSCLPHATVRVAA